MVSEVVKVNFENRLESLLKLIQKYNIDYVKLGIFGSYARGEYKSTSDIDICIVVNERPNRRTSGSLREEAELLGADIIFVSPDYLENDNSNFAKNLRRDFKQL